jgi:hypothetical protein
MKNPFGSFFHSMLERFRRPRCIAVPGGESDPAAADVSSGDFGTGFYPVDTGDYNFPNSKVGIKKSSPAEALDVTGNIKASQSIMPGSGYDIRWGDTSTRILGVAGAGGYLKLVTNEVERIRIKSDGKVGIGTDSPGETLEVSGGSVKTNRSIIAGNGYDVQWGDTSSRIIGLAGTSGYLSFRTNSAERMRIKSDGKVGIGTDSPIRPLHVKGGDIVVEGDPDAGGGLALMKPGQNEITTVIYRAGGSLAGQDYTILRTFKNYYYQENKYTALKIWAPRDKVVNDREATLSLVRGDSDEEFMDVYNNGYSTETQYGIRIAKNTGGEFRDFVFDQWDRTQTPDVKTTLMILKVDGKVGIGTASPLEKFSVAAGEIGLDEISDPAAPAANRARIYVRDNGSGKTQLVVRFSSGAVQVLATEP